MKTINSFLIKNFLESIQNIESQDFENTYIQNKRLPYYVLDKSSLYLELLLMRGLDPNLKSPSKKPLMFCASTKQLKLLLEYGGDPNIKWGNISLIKYIVNNEKNTKYLLKKINLLKLCGVKINSALNKKLDSCSLSFDENLYRKKNAKGSSIISELSIQKESVYKYVEINGKYDFVKEDIDYDNILANFILRTKKFDIIKL
jgi:hypothetical protein